MGCFYNMDNRIYSIFLNNTMVDCNIMIMDIMKLDVDNLHVYKKYYHKDCEWYWMENMECTNWRTFKDPEDYALLECFQKRKRG